MATNKKLQTPGIQVQIRDDKTEPKQKKVSESHMKTEFGKRKNILSFVK